jgi:hypothetical protein
LDHYWEIAAGGACKDTRRCVARGQEASDTCDLVRDRLLAVVVDHKMEGGFFFDKRIVGIED